MASYFCKPCFALANIQCTTRKISKISPSAALYISTLDILILFLINPCRSRIDSRHNGLIIDSFTRTYFWKTILTLANLYGRL